jgi:hypothetical protein
MEITTLQILGTEIEPKTLCICLSLFNRMQDELLTNRNKDSH